MTRIEYAAKLWTNGVSKRVIANKLGVTLNRFDIWVHRHPNMFAAKPQQLPRCWQFPELECPGECQYIFLCTECYYDDRQEDSAFGSQIESSNSTLE